MPRKLNISNIFSFSQYMLLTDSSDQLHRSHIMQYHCGYCKLEYLLGYSEGALKELAMVLHHMRPT